eukprot:TRINITY_DN74600_c0_g1_i1.p1 TRINITY_DN74600_c0_g1~~TRINITY_DN74600_c0_g1_i1.p1  ORF type:complete len:1349 (-),score=312.96 TRINITY_DN74600_c0_g1_i1:44-4090(-)
MRGIVVAAVVLASIGEFVCSIRLGDETEDLGTQVASEDTDAEGTQRLLEILRDEIASHKATQTNTLELETKLLESLETGASTVSVDATYFKAETPLSLVPETPRVVTGVTSATEARAKPSQQEQLTQKGNLKPPGLQQQTQRMPNEQTASDQQLLQVPESSEQPGQPETPEGERGNSRTPRSPRRKGTKVVDLEVKLDEKVDMWWKSKGLVRLMGWDTAKALEFFQQEEMPEVSQALESNPRLLLGGSSGQGTDRAGPALFHLFQRYDEEKAHAFGFKGEEDWMEAKIMLWSRLVGDKKGDSKLDIEARERCPSACSTYSLDYVFAMEWSVFNPFSLWPNPIHAYACTPQKWEEKDMKPTLTVDRSESGLGALLKMLGKELLNNLLEGLLHAGKAAVELGKSLAGCSLCAVCMVFWRLIDMLLGIGKALQQAFDWLTSQKTGSDSSLARQHMLDGFEDSLLEQGNGLFKSFTNNVKFRDLSDDQLNHTFTRMERRRKAAISMIEVAREVTKEMVVEHVHSFFDDRLPMGLLARPRDAANSSSLLQQGSEWMVPDIEVPEDCKDLMTESGELKQMHNAYQIGCTIEEGALGDAHAALAEGNMADFKSNILPQFLVMIIPAKPEYGQCLYAPQKLQEAMAMQCTPKHRAMCMLSMKYELFHKMTTMQFPPIELSMWQRHSIEKALTSAVGPTCLGEGFLFGRWRFTSKDLEQGSRGPNLTKEEEMNKRDYSDCKMLNHVVKKMDTESGLYSARIWFAAVQTYILEQQAKNGDKANVGEAGNIAASQDDPDVDPFIYQFCETVLDCSPSEPRKSSPEGTSTATPAKPGTHDRKMRWKAFMDTFQVKKREATDAENAVAVEQAKQTRMQMAQYWRRALEEEEDAWATDDAQALADLGQVYTDKMRVHVKKAMSADEDPFNMPSIDKPLVVDTWGQLMDDKFTLLFQPNEGSRGGSFQVVKVSQEAHVKRKYIWIGGLKDSMCSVLHMTQDCRQECSECHVTNDLFCSTSACWDRQVGERGCKKSGSKQKCQDCLNTKDKARIVDCNDDVDNEFLSATNVVQDSWINGGDKAMILNLLWESNAKGHEKTRSVSSFFMQTDKTPFMRYFFRFPEAENDWTRKKTIAALFQKIREYGRCECSCHAIRDFQREGQKYYVAVRPETGKDQCTPASSKAPVAICCPAEINEEGDLLGTFKQFACSSDGQGFEKMGEFCAKKNMNLCTKSQAAWLFKQLHQQGKLQSLREALSAADGQSSSMLRKCAGSLDTPLAQAEAQYAPFAMLTGPMWVRTNKECAVEDTLHNGALLEDIDACENRHAKQAAYKELPRDGVGPMMVDPEAALEDGVESTDMGREM